MKKDDERFFFNTIKTIIKNMRLFFILIAAAQMSLSPLNAKAQKTDLVAIKEALGPRVFCGETSFDFGEKSSDESVIEHNFLIQNTGTADLEINKVQTTCGCTLAELEKSILQPGESTILKAKLTLAGRDGEIQKPIFIESNDPENPNFHLVMKGRIGAVFHIMPGTIVLTRNSEDAPAFATAIVKSARNELFEILSARTESEKIKVEWNKSLTENSYEIKAILHENVESLQNIDRIILEINHPKNKNLEIPIIILTHKPIIAIPKKITVNANRLDSASKAIMIKSTTDEKLRINKVETPNPLITVNIELTGDYSARIVLQNIQSQSVQVGQCIRIQLGSGQIIQIPFEISDKNK